MRVISGTARGKKLKSPEGQDVRPTLDRIKEDIFNIFDTKQISDTLTSTTTLMTRIMAAVAAISLIVGGIAVSSRSSKI